MKESIHKMVIGMGGTSIGIAISQTNAEAWLRILSLVVGIAVGIASLISICFSIRRKYRIFKMEKKHAYKDEETTTV